VLGHVLSVVTPEHTGSLAPQNIFIAFNKYRKASLHADFEGPEHRSREQGSKQRHRALQRTSDNRLAHVHYRSTW
jgi:hypothetical protein